MNWGKGLKKTAWTGLCCLWLLQGVSGAEEPWREDFDRTCAKTQVAMELSVSELKQLIERCAALQKVIEAQDDSVRKVYGKRLQLCRNLYAYVLDYKTGAAPQK